MKIAFDIGGTNTRVARVSEGGVEGVLKSHTIREDPHAGIELLAKLAKEVAGSESIEAATGGIRGRMKGDVYFEDKVLSKWEGVNLVEEISKALEAPTRVEHDTAMAGLGEVHFGAGRGSTICAYVTVSTGVGGDRFVEGRLDRYTYNPEIGRQLVDGAELEDLVSGSAVQKKFGIHPKELASLEEREKLAEMLAVGLYNTTVHWSPDTIVLGGSMIVGVNPIPIDRVDSLLSQRLTMYPSVPALKMAELSDDGGLYGAAALLLSKG